MIIATKRRRAIVGVVLGALGTALVFAWRDSRLIDPPSSILLRDRHGQFLAELGHDPDQDRGYWPVDDLPERVVAATLIAEDRRFFAHFGVDFRAIVRAVRQNLTSRHRVSGASTLAMQVVRLQKPRSTRTVTKKAMEALSAILMTLRYGRNDVLRQYLRLAPYGHQIRGIAYAARRYLDKPVEDLSWAETAFLCALPQAPGRMNPWVTSGRRAAERRAAWILRSLHERRLLSDVDLEAALLSLPRVLVVVPPRRPQVGLHAALKFERRRTAAKDPQIDSTLDLELMTRIQGRMRRWLSLWKGAGAENASVIVVELGTNAVRAWIGSQDYFDTPSAGAFDFATVWRSPGSALKPFVYALALDRKAIEPNTILADLPMADSAIRNFDDEFLGPLLPRMALASSRNVPAVEVLERVGLDVARDHFVDLGLVDPIAATEATANAGWVVGTQPVTLERLVAAYTVFANEGKFIDLRWTEAEIPTSRRVLSESAARMINLFLSDPSARMPTFQRMGSLEYPFAVAAKTGSSSGYRDAWTLAWSRRFLVGVWVGNAAWREMRELTGGRSAAELARDALMLAHSNATPADHEASAFSPPRDAEPIALCSRTGLVAVDACEQKVVEWFPPAEGPIDTCTAHVERGIDRRSGQLATRATPREHVMVRRFVNLGPEYSAWALRAGLPQLPSDASYLAADAPFSPSREHARIRVRRPADGLRVMVDPETPKPMATLSLEAIVEPHAPQAVWYVDNKPYAVVDFPYAWRWPLEKGEHVFEVRLPFREERSRAVRVVVE